MVSKEFWLLKQEHLKTGRTKYRVLRSVLGVPELLLYCEFWVLSK